MSFLDIEIQDQYRSDNCSDIGSNFISKMLAESVVYKRAVGFFSSSALLKISYGISKLIAHDECHMCFVVSPLLYKEDIDAINKGYKKRADIITGALLRQFEDTNDEFECERLNLLCHLIEAKILDIKVASKISVDASGMGMFHEKIGVFVDQDGNRIAFSGSLNESDNAFSNNFESIQVFKSWEEEKRVHSIEENFDLLWEDKTRTLEVFDFPEAAKNKLFQYRKETFRDDIDEYEARKKASSRAIPKYGCSFPLYSYQKKAIQKWADQGYRGMFDMGTGTGKTITALTASTILLKKLNYRLATVIVCPFTHLVEQWVQEEKNFGVKFIVGYSDKKYKNYIYDLKRAVQNYNDGVADYFFFITTNASYKTEKVQAALNEIKGDVLFIADEVHNLGAKGNRLFLNSNFKYRIGLSATIERHKDEVGTEAIKNYFGDTVIEYGLKEAIESGVLTRYYYYPITVCLTDFEVEKYLELTAKIGKQLRKKDGKISLTKEGERLAIIRARLIATAQAKINALKELLIESKEEHGILVYCGTGVISSDDNSEEIRQIDEVCKMLGNDLGMKIAKYTSEENADERHLITDRFKNGDDLQALVAIKCLDEGVNIPSIRKAFILASSTNPREYIQRRGRVLRKCVGKAYSYIFDFITMPIELDEKDKYSSEYLKSFKALAKNELERIREFSSLAENQRDSDALSNKIEEAFGTNEIDFNDEFEKIEWEEVLYGE